MHLNILKVFLLLLYLRNSNLTFLPIGINQLNNFIYFQRLTYYDYQNANNKCSLEEGPNCYFIEPLYIKSLKKENQTLKKDYIEKDWISLTDDLNVYTYQEIYDDLLNKIKKYYNNNINKNDKEQKVPIQEFHIYITFEKYDSITINKDIYLDKITYLSYENERIPLVIEGKIRLKYEKSNIIVKNIMDYPSKTYAIIESNRAIISLSGKNFKIISFYVRPKNIYNDENIKITIIGSIQRNIAIEGYNNNKLVFSSNYQFSYVDEKFWNKIMISNNLFINKLIIPGNFEIDNILLSVEGNYVYDIQSLFYHDPKRKTIDLINDNDI